MPSRIGQLSGRHADRDSLMSARPSQLVDYGLKGLAPIREDVRSAERDPYSARGDSQDHHHRKQSLP